MIKSIIMQYLFSPFIYLLNKKKKFQFFYNNRWFQRRRRNLKERLPDTEQKNHFCRTIILSAKYTTQLEKSTLTICAHLNIRKLMAHLRESDDLRILYRNSLDFQQHLNSCH